MDINILVQKRNKRIEAEREENEALMPKLLNPCLLTKVYNWYIQTSKEIVGFPEEYSSGSRLRFIFIALWLYSPASLLPDGLRTKMKPGQLRTCLSQILKIDNMGVISHLVPIVSNNHIVYKSFRSDVDYLWEKLKDSEFYADLLLKDQLSKNV